MQFVYIVIAINLSLVACLHISVFYRSANEKVISKSDFEDRNIIVLANDTQDCQKACKSIGTCQFEDYGYLSDIDRIYLLNAAVGPHCAPNRSKCDEELLNNETGTYLTPNAAHSKQTKKSHPFFTESSCCISGYSRIRGDPLPECEAMQHFNRRLCTCRKREISSASTTASERSTASTSIAENYTASTAASERSTAFTPTLDCSSAYTSSSESSFASTFTTEVYSASESSAKSTYSTVSSASSTDDTVKNTVILAVSLSFFAVTLISVCAYLLWKRRRKNLKSKKLSVAYLNDHPPSKFGTESSRTTQKNLKSDLRTAKAKTTKTTPKNSSTPKTYAKTKSSSIVYSGQNISTSSDNVYEIVN